MPPPPNCSPAPPNCPQCTQRAWRRHVGSCAATVIQASWRGRVARQAYLRARTQVVHLQALCRGAAARRRLWEHAAAAVLLQSAWRAKLARKELAGRKAQYLAHLQSQQAELLMEIGREFMRKWVSSMCTNARVSAGC